MFWLIIIFIITVLASYSIGYYHGEERIREEMFNKELNDDLEEDE